MITCYQDNMFTGFKPTMVTVARSGGLVMGYIIGMISQKGGVGKSHSRPNDGARIRRGGMSVKVADLDTQQQTCTHWAGRRAENGVTPEIQVRGFASVRSAVEDAARFDAYILDGKPNASEQTFEVAKVCDLVVIPTGQTVDDLHPGVVLAHTLIERVCHCTGSPLPCSRRRGASARTAQLVSISNRRDTWFWTGSSRVHRVWLRVRYG